MELVNMKPVNAPPAAYERDKDGPIPRWLNGVTPKIRRDSRPYKDAANLFRRLLHEHGGADNLNLREIIRAEKIVYKLWRTTGFERDSFRGLPIEDGVYVNLCNSLAGDLNKLGQEAVTVQETALDKIVGRNA